MNYERIYNALIERARDRDIQGYVERHHIIPRCMGGSDDKENLVKLTPEEHYLAHQLLIKIYPDNKKLVSAAVMMIPSRPSNKLYGWLKRRFAKLQSDSQSGTMNSQFGTKWIFNEEKRLCKRIPLEEDVPQGWERGRVVDFDSYFQKKELERLRKLESNAPKKPKPVSKEETIRKIKTKHLMFKKTEGYRRAKSIRLYNQFIASGLSLRQFAIQNNIVPMTLSKWFREFIDDYQVVPRKNANKQLQDKKGR